MKDFETPDYPESIGGCRTFSFTPVKFIEFIPEPVNGIIDSDIRFFPDGRMYQGYSTKGVLSFSETAKITPSGLIYTVIMKGFSPGNNEGMVALFDMMAKNRFVLLVTDNQGVTRLVGSKKEPLSFTADFSTGINPGDRMGYTYAFEGNLTSPSPVYAP